ncbi:unnamed protein product [Sphagnum tenellum]
MDKDIRDHIDTARCALRASNKKQLLPPPLISATAVAWHEEGVVQVLAGSCGGLGFAGVSRGVGGQGADAAILYFSAGYLSDFSEIFMGDCELLETVLLLELLKSDLPALPRTSLPAITKEEVEQAELPL